MPPNPFWMAGALIDVWASSNGAIIPEMMSNSCSGVVASVTRERFAATTADQSVFFSAKNGYCSAHVVANTSKFEIGVSGVGLSHVAGLRPMRRRIMSDAAPGLWMRASLAVRPGMTVIPAGLLGGPYAASAPDGAGAVAARN